jgi:short-subunit dehydrogenase
MSVMSFLGAIGAAQKEAMDADERVIIIGASSGIGKELAKLFAQNNDKVGITGRRIGLLNELKSKNRSID